ncbi:hypothetical protein TUBRATIS_13280 [Tubulinosema ratisbonensis]|uniref:Uncharacterized protein n=1 Tax=Tubulinosema ratisbonensis TaxID=291195 RepID=A0A437AMC8_9MICR|nr:hypothetical protein TUBRATIS_13280 [Tubulinosema ratisbonensis]
MFIFIKNISMLTSICQKGVQALSLTQQNLLGNPLRNIASLFPCLQQYPCIQQLLARTANTPFSLPLFQGCLDELNKIIDSKEAVQTLPKQPSKLDKIIHEVSLGNVVMKELFDYIKNAVPIKSTDPAVPQPIDPAVPQPIDTTVSKPIDTTDSIQPTTNDTNFDKIIDKLDALEKKLDNIDPSVLDSLLKFQSTTEEKLKTMEEIQEREYYENQERSDKMNKLLQDISDQVKENTKSLDKNRADINRNGSILSDFESQIDLLNKEVSELKNKIDKTKDEIENLKKGTGIGGGN